jgi:hypothetical protein
LTLDNGSEFAAYSKINEYHSIDVFLRNHTQVGNEEQMKTPMAGSEDSGQKKMI